MQDVFIVRAGDISRLEAKGFKEFAPDSIVCSRLAEIDPVLEAASVYFVISELATCSTDYQALALAALTKTKNSKHFLLFLDEVPIPIGLERLKSLSKVP